jgi:hypothetical protein
VPGEEAPGEAGRPPEDEATGWARLLAPLRSEAAAFRMLLWVATLFGVLIVVVLIVRAL